jgi:hypothetical protein
MKRSSLLAFVVLFILTACQQKWVYEADRQQRLMVTNPPVEVTYDVPPQVIYRIDDHRFLTLENYNECYGYAWYHDTKQGVRTKVGLMWPNGFHGKLVIDDPTGMNVAVPTVSTNLCGDRGCLDYVAYSTDGGRSFHWLHYDIYDHTPDPVESSKSYTFSVTKDSLYITMPDGNFGRTLSDRYPLAPGYIYGRDAKLPEGVGIHFNVELPSGLHTPSGQDHYTCDASIHDPKVKQ